MNITTTGSERVVNITVPSCSIVMFTNCVTDIITSYSVFIIILYNNVASLIHLSMQYTSTPVMV